MATHLKKDKQAATFTVDKSVQKSTIAVVVSDWNSDITHALRDGAVQFLKEQGLKAKNILVHAVPGAYELPQAAMWLAQQKQIDAVIALGCVIQGETRHFDFICDACAHGIMQVGLTTKKPAVFGVLTTDTLKQAVERSGGKYGNKGKEAAETALKMLELKRHILQ
ncbi:MAG: 6,7-dimethyl-8-ribityllumazine synthase [Bacteroidia bacterium]|jgi:6,7-dimethyl-8-ribityllumazine synthase|nr:6,7-dimethyl-8-ribityllumazine synthase [Bacteroidia bacterium]